MWSQLIFGGDRPPGGFREQEEQHGGGYYGNHGGDAVIQCQSDIRKGSFQSCTHWSFALWEAKQKNAETDGFFVADVTETDFQIKVILWHR